MEDWQELIKETLDVLYPDVKTYNEMKEIFEYVLLNGNLELSNNKAERAVKSLMIDHNNWLVSPNFERAVASSIILSLIETAKKRTCLLKNI